MQQRIPLLWHSCDFKQLRVWSERCERTVCRSCQARRRLQLSSVAPTTLQAVNFSSYDAYRKLMQLRHGGEHLGRMGSFGAGALAGWDCTS